MSQVTGYDVPRHLFSRTPLAVQQEAVGDLIKRCLGENMASLFVVNITDQITHRTFDLRKTNDRILITGSDGVSAAKGFHHYMKYYLMKDITWTDTRINVPSKISLPDVQEISTSASSFIYYQNVCTWGYSFVWWDWSTWQSHIDWMAMMGISLTIAPTQEEIWYRIYKEMGMTEDEIDDHFSGVAFQPWQRMGNIRGFGGPLPSTYRQMQMLLQKHIIMQQRKFGITVALPAFAGHVPVAMRRLFPKVTFTAVDRWNNFPDKYCCPLFLEPEESLFQEIGMKFLQNVIDYYGSDHIYFSDPFNEIQPKNDSVSYLNMTAFHIYNTMRSIDSDSYWLLQGWMFVKNIYWTDELIKSFLTAVPIGRMIILDLQSEQFPQYEKTHSYFGQPFIWCMLHNFGGTLGMFGSVKTVNEQIEIARKMKNSSMIGVGIAPEGINQNYVLYALCLERGWAHESFNLDKWFKRFVDARYCSQDRSLQSAWILLRDSVYSYYGMNKMRGKYTITRRPAMNMSPWTWYNGSLVQEAWRLLLAANGSIIRESNCHDFYEHDLVDISRQFLQITADRLYVNLVSSYRKHQIDRFEYIGAQLMKVFDHLELILATNEHFLLGRWLEAAKLQASNAAEATLFEMNARNQITAWGPDGQILDYSTKQWSGIVRDYYQPRWELFLQMANASLRNGTGFDSKEFKRIVSKNIEIPFSYKTKTYPVIGVGDPLSVSKVIYNYWTTMMSSKTYLHMTRKSVRILRSQAV